MKGSRYRRIRERVVARIEDSSKQDRIDAVLHSLPAEYEQEFDDEHIAAHLLSVAALNREAPFKLLFEHPDEHPGDDRRPGDDHLADEDSPVDGSPVDYPADNRYTVTIICADRRGMFSLLTGLLAAGGLGVERGHVYTLESHQASRSHTRPRRGGRFTDRSNAAVGGVYMPRLRRANVDSSWAGDDAAFGGPGRVIIDQLTGTLSADAASFESYLSESFEKLFERLVGGDEVGARRYVAEEVATQVANLEPSAGQVLAPISVELESNGSELYTRISVESEDTPFFLYSVSNALNLHDVAIEQVTIETTGTHIRDVFDIRDATGGAIRSEARLDRIRLSILLTKQFTYVLDRAPDPYAAMHRFDQLIGDFRDLDRGEDVQRLMSDRELQQELAVLLGASDFLWEDFIRRQQEQLLPMLASLEHRKPLSIPEAQIRERLEDVMSSAGATAREQGGDVTDTRVSALNEFKDREGYLVDLDHMLLPDLDFFFLSRRLTCLAEAVVDAAAVLAWEATERKFGRPRTAAGLTARWAAFGLGKLGGSALGYASDIELLFIYSDSGRTDGASAGQNGASSVENAVYFEEFFRTTAAYIHARREGIFQTDLRLRPHGDDGPLAVKLDRFVEYYSADGAAHAAERLALVRLRAIAGNKRLGRRVEGIRDEILYESESVNVKAIRDLRRTQLDEKGSEDRVNAKFSPGGLVDVEYNVQLLQVTHGRRNLALRCPGIHDALRGLHEEGTIDAQESDAMIEAYRFLRRLINGLRMLRGNAQDLFLPQRDSVEYNHLARRIGYTRDPDVSAAQKLSLDFDTQTAVVRGFVERHLGRDAIPGARNSGPADLVLTPELSDEARDQILSRTHFGDTARAMNNLRDMSRRIGDRRLFARVLILAWDTLTDLPDSDMVLNNWERFLTALIDPDEHCRELASQPERLRLLFTLFGTSQFLSDILIREPELFHWVTDSSVVRRQRTERELRRHIRRAYRVAESREAWLNAVRRIRKHEILRIGMRDLCLRTRLAEVAAEISSLARSILEVALQVAWARTHRRAVWDRSPRTNAEAKSRGAAVPRKARSLAVLAFGKLGGGELNYSSDIDLMAIFQPAEATSGAEEQIIFATVFRNLVQDLTEFTEEGQAYRVDLRLRPHGDAGPSVATVEAAGTYYAERAHLWELQAMLKCSPIAGATKIGQRFISRVHDGVAGRFEAPEIVESVQSMRKSARAVHVRGDRVDVKNGIGGIRDVEFLAQALQLIHVTSHPGVFAPDTLSAIARLADAGLLDRSEARELTQDYQLLRQAEHFLQLAEDRQLHALPTDTGTLGRLAFTLNTGHDAESIEEHIRSRMKVVHQHYKHHLVRHSATVED